MVSRRMMLSTSVGIAAGVTTSGCSAPDSPKWVHAGAGKPGVTPSPTSTVRVTVTPAAEAKDISPGDPILISAESGTLQAVTVTTDDTTVAGELDPEQRTWQSTDSLKYNKTYTVAVVAVDAAGLAVEHTSSFATLKPAATASITFQANSLVALKKGGTYGVGQPVIVHFGKTVKNRTAAQNAIEVITEPAVEGRWRWINGRDAHWRPAKYWIPGTKITVKVKVLGVDLGGGVYGATNATTRFSIGPSRIAVADANTHHMQCFVNGKMVRDIPVSLGKGGTATTADGKTVHFWTNSGPHIILVKSPTVRMTSSSYGVKDPEDPNYYDELVKLCCRISYSGEFVHLADWNVPAHGQTNTSHGCINVGPSNAQWFYDTFQLGDVVEVKNSPRTLAIDNGVGDWNMSWEKW
ncbi:MAG: L,D-transpeptidase family protein [Dactylosporangium sp.]|nr:L,D-transpeptidase family protein [Dactylosporangium sp.]NNJ61483.1 L,D-transpeptidase family protein [Dactylosporangium sp.]